MAIPEWAKTYGRGNQPVAVPTVSPAAKVPAWLQAKQPPKPALQGNAGGTVGKPGPYPGVPGSPYFKPATSPMTGQTLAENPHWWSTYNNYPGVPGSPYYKPAIHPTPSPVNLYPGVPGSPYFKPATSPMTGQTLAENPHWWSTYNNYPGVPGSPYYHPATAPWATKPTPAPKPTVAASPWNTSGWTNTDWENYMLHTQPGPESPAATVPPPATGGGYSYGSYGGGGGGGGGGYSYSKAPPEWYMNMLQWSIGQGQ